MIEPPPPAIIAGTPYLHPNATPFTLIASVRSQTAASVESTEPSLPSMTPALLYRTSSLPNRATAASTIASASASLETSAWTYAASPPSEEISAATESPVSSATSVSTTLAPSDANSLDATMPMPLAPPVISATFPSRRIRSPSRESTDCRSAEGYKPT